MPMPERNGHAVQGGWANGSTTTINGNTNPTDVIITDRYNATPIAYTATNSITFVGEYTDNGNDDYVAYIDDGNTTSGSNGGSTNGENGYRYGFNGQENSNDVTEGNYTAEYWEYDSRIGRRWNQEPKPNPSISNYACFNNNPIWFVDVRGDSSVWDNKGYQVHYDPKDKDLRAFMQDGDKLTLMGELGKNIDASKWFGNLLKDNSVEADGISSLNPWGFKNRVKQYGKWDYKYASPANPDANAKQHILGIAFYRKDKAKGIGDLGETMFSFDGNTGRAEDLNNYHFGVVGDAYGVFSETFMLKTAGAIEMDKWKSEGKEVPASWRPTTVISVPTFIKTERLIWKQETILLAPYGDNPTDHEWIKKGFQYYNKNRSNLDGDWW